MSEEKQILTQLRDLPKPDLTKEKQDQMFHRLQDVSFKNEKKQRREMMMRKGFAGIAAAAAILILSVVSYSFIVNEDSNRLPGASIEEKQDTKPHPAQLDPIDLALPEHQVAIGDLFFEIPTKKDEVLIQRRDEDGYRIVDVRDEQTNELLYRFGESMDPNHTEKLVYREVYSESFKTKVRLQVAVEIDSANGMIKSLNKQRILFDPLPDRIEREEIFAMSRTGEFPASSIQVLAHIQLARFNSNTTDPANMTEIERLQEGYFLGAIKK